MPPRCDGRKHWFMTGANVCLCGLMTGTKDPTPGATEKGRLAPIPTVEEKIKALQEALTAAQARIAVLEQELEREKLYADRRINTAKKILHIELLDASPQCEIQLSCVRPNGHIGTCLDADGLRFVHSTRSTSSNIANAAK